MSKAIAFIREKLEKRKHDGLLRELPQENNLIDFSSNDYLGFASDPAFQLELIPACKKHPAKTGSTGSRLLTGNSKLAEELEQDLATFFGAGSALIFNSGYDANIGLLSSLPQRADTVITDELVHASIIDGVRLNYAERFIFKHNNLSSLEEKLKRAKGCCYIVVESVYSMDGDIAPLPELVLLAKKYQAHLIVDEAHAVGICKRGLCVEYGLQDDVFARIVTFGKALGSHGAAILGPYELRNYLINFSRSFIFTTAQSPHALLTTKLAIKKLAGADEAINRLNENIRFFCSALSGVTNSPAGQTAIQQVIIPGNEAVRKAAGTLQKKGFDVRPIVSPTVAAGTERLRICLHSFNTQKQVAGLMYEIGVILNDL